MLERPIMKGRYRALLVEGQGVALLSPHAEHLVPARLYDELLPLLDGTSTEALVEHFRGRWTPTDVCCVLWHLERRGCLEEAHDDSGRMDAPASDPVAAPGLTRARISLTVLGALPADEWRAALLNHGFVLDDTDGLPTLLTDSYLRPELADINEWALQTGRRWLLANPVGPVMWIGPAFSPEKSACWKCLEARLRRNHPFEYHMMRGACATRRLDASRGPARTGDGFSSFARELYRVFQRFQSGEPTDSVLIVNSSDGTRSGHRVPQRPQCPACGSPGLYAQRTAVPVRLRPQRKHTTEASTCRVTDPGETLPWFRGFLDPLVGAVHDIEPLHGGAGGPSCVYETHYGGEPASHTTFGAYQLHRTSGKGRNDVEARTSGLGEAIERYSACFQGDEPRRWASLEELGTAAIHPNLCMQFSDSQYGDRAEWNHHCPSFEWIPVPLESTRRLDWTPLWPLSGGEPRYLPTMLLYSGYPTDPEEACCVFDPSGGAAGNTPEEAVLQGLFELIERDSLALWWYNRAPRPKVDLGGLTDPHCRRVISYHQSQGRDLWVLDVTSDLTIPAFVAVSRRVGSGPEHIVLGAGAHLEPRIAIGRAVSEMDQILTCLSAWDCDGTLGTTARNWLHCATLENQPYLAPGPFAPTRPEDMPNLATSDLMEDIRVCEGVLARHHMVILLLDQTRPDLGVSVMKVIVPGLRHFRRRFAPERLYTAPPAAGWLRQPRLEAELNPIGFFL